MQVALGRRAEGSGDGHGERVLHDPAIYFHAETGERVGLDGTGGLDLGLEDHGAFGQAHHDVGPESVAQRLGNRFKTDSFREETR